MYEESGYYDPNPIPALLDGLTQDATSINSTGNILDTTNLIRTSTFSLEEFAHSTDHEPNCNVSAMGGLESLQHHLGFDLEQEIHSHLIHPDMPMPMPMMSLDNATSWDQNTHQDLGQLPHYMVNTDVQQQLDHHFPLQTQDPAQCYDTAPLPNYTTDPTPYTSSTPPPDLLNLLHLPRYTVAPPILPSLQQTPLLPTDIARNNNCYPLDIFGGSGDIPIGEDGGTMLQMGYHPPLPHHQNNLLRDLFHSLPQNYGVYSGAVDEGDAGGGGGGGGGMSVFQEDMNIGRYDKNPVFDYRREVKVEKGTFATEKQRRVQMNGKYDVLKSLIPNLSKTDRASIVMGAIDYIQELQRTVTELKLLIEKKRYGRNNKRSKIEMSMDPTVITPSSNDIIESSSVIRHLAGGDDNNMIINKDLLFNDTLRSSWLQRESRETFIDVRIVDDEVNLKMTQKKKMNCLLIAVKALDELHLDIVHVSAGFIGERYVFLFNTKIFEGSPVYASAIAKKMLEVMEKPYVSSPSKISARVLI